MGLYQSVRNCHAELVSASSFSIESQSKIPKQVRNDSSETASLNIFTSEVSSFLLM